MPPRIKRAWGGISYLQSQAECKEKAEEAALDSGILEKASENAATMIRSMLYGFLDSEEYDIEFY